MAQPNPFDQFDNAPAGPVYGPPPKAAPPATPLQMSAEERARRDQQMQEEKFAWEREKAEKDREAGVGIQGTTRESENKGASFLLRALGSNEAYEKTGVGPRSWAGQTLSETAPNLLNALPGAIGNSPERQVSDSAQNEFIMATLRQDSGAAIPEEELERHRRTYFPMPGEGPEAIEQKRQARLRAIEGLKMSAGRLEPEVQERYQKLQIPEKKAPVVGLVGEAAAVPEFSEGDPRYQAAQGRMRAVPDKALSNKLFGMFKAGRSMNEINDYAQSQGAAPIIPNQEAIDYARKHPDWNPFTATRYEPVSTYEKAATKIGGTAPGAYAIGAGQFLSANTLDNMQADPEGARLAMEIARTQSPNATLAGEVTGGTLAALTGEAALARLGVANPWVAGALADAGTGAAQGAGAADDGNRLGGAAQGGLAALAGNVVGTVGSKVVGNMIAPTGGSLSDLYAQGVRPTPGQRFVNAGDGKGVAGMAGRALNATEEALQSVPIVGSAIRGARQEARDQFQTGAFNQALSEIGEALPKGMKVGTDPHKFAQEAFNRVYEKARTGMTMVPDADLANDLAALAPDIETLGPQAQAKLKAIMANAINNKLKAGGGQLSGDLYKSAVSDLGKHIARYRKGVMAEDQQLADVLEGVKGSIDGAARRSSDPDAVALLDAADAGYAKLVRIEEAAMRRGGEAGTFSPAGFDSSVQKSAGGVRSKAYLRGDALMEDYAQAGRSLEDRLPNSGTADRVMVGYGLGTTATGGATYATGGAALPLLGAIGLAYAPGVRKATKGLMAPAGDKRKAVRAQLEKRKRLIGAATAAGAVAAQTDSGP